MNFNLSLIPVEMQTSWGMLADSFVQQDDTVVFGIGTPQIDLIHDLGYYTLGQQITIPAGGHPVRFNWPPVPGATGAEVTAAAIRISPVATQHSIGELTIKQTGSHYEVTTGSKRIRTLKLTNLKFTAPGADEQTTLQNTSDLPGGWRLVVSLPDGNGGWLPPSHSVPSVGSQGMIPATLTGATFANRVLTLPDIVTPKIRLTLAEGGTPDDFSPQSFTLAKVEGTETLGVKDLLVEAPDGVTLAAFPGDLPLGRPPLDIDLRVPLETAMETALAAGAAPDVTFTIRGSGTIRLVVIAADGSLLREVPGVTRTVIEGDPLTPALSGPFPTESATATTADLTVRYEGVRLLETVTDPVPAVQGGLIGEVVMESPVRREFPPQGLDGRAVRRIGVVGRAPEAAEVHVQLVRAVSGAAIGAPGVLEVAPSTEVTTHWVDLPEHTPITEPVALSVRAVSGRFFWVVQGHPLARIAIFDPDYEPRPVTLGGVPLSLIPGEMQTHLPGYAFAPMAFAGQSPTLLSDLFLTVDIGDLVLRYAR